MKKKIALFALAFVILASIFAVIAVAEDSSEPALSIEAANLEIGDSVYLLYAVSHEKIEAKDIRLLFWSAPQSGANAYTASTANYYATYSEDGVSVLGAENCALFKNETLRAKNMADDVFARAYAIVDGKEYYSEVSKYSILQYAYNKLGKTGTPSDNAAFKTMLIEMLEYGAAAQAYTGHNTDRPADAEYYQIAVKGGTLADGFEKGLFLEGDNVVLCAPEVSGDLPFTAWVNAAGIRISTEHDITVTVGTKNETYTAMYGEHIHTDSDKNDICDSCLESVIIVIDFYAINDLHGKFCDTNTQIGVDELATYLKNAKSTDDHAIFLSSGDMFQGSAESNLTHGVILTEWMNMLGFSSMTLGNHEFDWGEDAIRENLAQAEFPFLAINVYDKETQQPEDFCTPSVMVDLGNAQVGIIGAIGDCYNSISADRSTGVEFKTGEELAALVRAEANRLISLGADFIVYSLHDGYGNSLSGETNMSNASIADYYQAALTGVVDIVFEGHSHCSYVIKDEDGTYHLQGGGENYGISHAEISLNFCSGDFDVNIAEIVDVDQYAHLEDDPETEALEDAYSETIEAAYAPIGYVDATVSQASLRDYMARAYLSAGLEKWGDTYNIVLAGGSINTRSPYQLQAGIHCYADALSLFPFDNRLTLCSISGADLLDRFVNNSSYTVAYSAYGVDILDSIDPEGTYYLIADTYSQVYKNNKLTLIEYYDEDTYARDLLAKGIAAGDFCNEISIPEVHSIGSALSANIITSEYYVVRGRVMGNPQATYGNLTIEDEVGNTLYVYGLYDGDGIRYDGMNRKPVAGDEIILRSQIYNYVHATDSTKNKVELKDATLIAIVK